MNKKIVLGVVTSLVIITVISVIIFINTRKKEIEPEIEEVIAKYEETESIEDIKTEKQEVQNEDIQEEIVQSPVIETPKEEKQQTNKISTSTNTNNKTNANSNTQANNTPKTAEQPKVEEKPEIPSTPKVEEKPVVERCTNNGNHEIGVGNCGKWYSSSSEGIVDYDNKQAYWGDLWTNYEIDTQEYDKNCPSRYEIYSCKYCNKWTLDYFYRQ